MITLFLIAQLMSHQRQRNFIILSQVFAGMGIGILMGLIIGLSVSPVVKSILGTLAGLLDVFEVASQGVDTMMISETIRAAVQFDAGLVHR